MHVPEYGVSVLGRNVVPLLVVDFPADQLAVLMPEQTLVVLTGLVGSPVPAPGTHVAFVCVFGELSAVIVVHDNTNTQNSSTQSTSKPTAEPFPGRAQGNCGEFSISIRLVE